MSVEQQTQHRSWTEASNCQSTKLHEAIETAYSMSDISSEEFEGVEVERAGFISTSVSLYLTEDEVNSAPREVRMVLDDLGITVEDDIQAQIIIDSLYERPHKFWLVLKPAKVTSYNKLGLGLSSDGNNFVIAPTSRDFDGVHKMVSTYVGRAANLHEVYVTDMGNRANPHLVDILSASVNWFKSLMDARQKPL